MAFGTNPFWAGTASDRSLKELCSRSRRVFPGFASVGDVLVVVEILAAQELGTGNAQREDARGQEFCEKRSGFISVKNRPRFGEVVPLPA
jgi:hypothetical protein